MNDLIDRQETLDALDKRFESLLKRFDYNSYENADEKTKLVCDGLSEAEDVVMGLPSALSTNLAEVGTDTISRQQAINKILGQPPEPHYPSWYAEQIKELPPAQPEIIYCKDCVKHNKGLGNYEVHPDGSTTWIWKDSACPLVSWRDKAQGHEFDYQFCAYAEKREVTT